MAQEGMPAKFDTSSLYVYYRLCEENCPQTTPPWDPLWYYYKVELPGTGGAGENTIVCSGPRSDYSSPFYLYIHYIIYPHPGFIKSFTDPGGDFEEFMGGIFPITFLRPALNFYEDYDSQKPKWSVPDSLLYGDGLGVPLMSLDQTDPVEGDLLLYSRIFPFPPPWEEYKSNPIYSTPSIVWPWEGAEDKAEHVVLDGYMGVSMEVKEMYGPKKNLELFRLPYHYEECDPGCNELAATIKGNHPGAIGGIVKGKYEDPVSGDNVTYEIPANAIDICSHGISGSATGIHLPPETVVNPQGGLGTSNSIDDIYLKYPDSTNKVKDVSNTEKSVFINQPLGPYPDYVEPYRDDTGMHDAVATVNLSWVFEQSTTILDQIENFMLETFDEECIYNDNCTLGELGGGGGGNLLKGGILNLPINVMAMILRMQLRSQNIYDLIKDAYISFQFVKLVYKRNPYSDPRCPEFTVYSNVYGNNTLNGPQDIFDLIQWKNGDSPSILPTKRPIIDEKNADFPVLGMGIWEPCETNDDSCFQPV
jgi:hypothetical protein